MRLTVLLTTTLICLSSCDKKPENKEVAPNNPNQPTQRPDAAFIGEWEGIQENGRKCILIIREDGDVVYSNGSFTLDQASMKGDSVIWELDMEADPMEFDIIIRPGAENEARMQCIVRLISDKSMMIRFGEGGDSRPENFANETDNNQVILRNTATTK